jgi:uncharacterized protein (DUF4213/DUF364 family)
VGVGLGAGWDIHDRLVDGVAPEAAAKACLVGNTWTLVESDGVGMAMTYRGGGHLESLPLPLSGRPLRELAEHVKSWSLPRASVGMAAINAFYNTPQRMGKWLARPLEELRSSGSFNSWLDAIAGKKVAVIGHFPGLDPVRERCELIVLERNPQDGDLPDFAAEYVLPEQDFVFITGTTITNKTLPRLLTLSAGATVVLMGPSVPMVPWLFDYGVDMLAGSVVIDGQAAWRACQEGAHRGVFDAGAWMVEVRRDDLNTETIRS